MIGIGVETWKLRVIAACAVLFAYGFRAHIYTTLRNVDWRENDSARLLVISVVGLAVGWVMGEAFSFSMIDQLIASFL